MAQARNLHDCWSLKWPGAGFGESASYAPKPVEPDKERPLKRRAGHDGTCHSVLTKGGKASHLCVSQLLSFELLWERETL